MSNPTLQSTTDETLLKGLASLTEKVGRLDAVEKSVTEQRAALEKAIGDLADLQKTAIEAQRRLATVRSERLRRGGEVTPDCARFLGTIGLLAAVRQQKLTDERGVARAATLVKDVLGLELRAALTAADIPLPVNYGAEVVELIAEFGQARTVGTVFPLGAAQTKLPKLGTTPAFGLIAMSAVIAQKSPTLTFVTFNTSKWGGLIVLPTELDDDSVVSVGQFIARYAAREMARLEDTVFFNADGTGTFDNLSGLLKAQDVAATRIVLAATKTANSDLTLAAARSLRGKVASPALARGAYYLHPSFESLLSGFNTAGDKPYLANGLAGASLDGYPIRWIDVLPPLNTAAAVNQVFGAFGDASFGYLGVRGDLRFDTSREFLFDTDNLAIRALERFTVQQMASDHVAVLKTAAA